MGALNKDTDELDSSSKRGPVIVDESPHTKPDLVTPGVSITSSIRGGKYGMESGTSMATPHVAGVVALLWSVVPNLTNNIEATEKYLNDYAFHISSDECYSNGWPNNLYG